MEVTEIGRWEKREETEVYFDEIFQTLISKNGPQLEIKKPGHQTPIKQILDKESQLICAQTSVQFRINIERSLICTLTQQEKLVTFT